MITLNLSGGLGNQMFQYAAARALTEKHKTGLTLELNEFEYYPLRSYMLDRFKLDKNIQTVTTHQGKLKRVLNRIIPDTKTYTEPHYHYDPAFFDQGTDVNLKGYFQSPRYFEDIQGIIRDEFTLSEPLSETGQEYQTQIEGTDISVSLHVRRGDYVSDAKTQAVHGSASVEYYETAVNHIRSSYGDDIHIFIFSDDPAYVEKTFAFCPDKTIVKGNTDIPHEDMMLMAACDHHIIANSSFSWWGAWLNPKADKTVIAPKQWFSAETLKTKSTQDLFPKDWITL